jgi:hypothetical protein
MRTARDREDSVIAFGLLPVFALLDLQDANDVAGQHQPWKGRRVV